MAYIEAKGFSTAGNAFICSIFGILCVIHTMTGVLFKKWRFTLFIFIGTSLSCIGYAGRAWYSKDSSYSPYVMQAVCVTMAPGFIIGGIKGLIIHYVALLRIKKIDIEPNWYTDKSLERLHYFESANKLSMIITSALIGPGIGAFYNADDEGSVLSSARVVLAGFSLQLAFTAIPMLFWIFFIHKYWKEDLVTKRMKSYMAANIIPLLLLIIRLAYRVAEWDKIIKVGLENRLTTNEKYLLCLDALPVLLACITMAIFHPGFVFGNQELTRADAEYEEYNKQRKLNRRGIKWRLRNIFF